MAALIGCRPEIIGENHLVLTLRFSSEEERDTFKEAVREAHLSREEYFVAYAEKNDIALGTSVATD